MEYLSFLDPILSFLDPILAFLDYFSSQIYTVLAVVVMPFLLRLNKTVKEFTGKKGDISNDVNNNAVGDTVGENLDSHNSVDTPNALKQVQPNTWIDINPKQ